MINHLKMTKMTNRIQLKIPTLHRIYRAICALVKNNIDWRFRGINVFKRKIILDESSFDSEFYCSHNPDILDRRQDPFRHFLEHGIYENRKARFFDTHWYIRRYPDLLRGRIDAYSHFRLVGDREGRAAQFISFRTELVRPLHNNYKEWVEHYDSLGKADLKYIQAEAIKQSASRLCFIVVDNDEKSDMTTTTSSILAQLRPMDELWLVSETGSSRIEALLANLEDKAGRITVWSSGETPTEKLNSVIAQTSADFVTVVSAGDRVNRSAIYWITKAVNEIPLAEIIYSDEDQLNSEGKRSAPYFKPKPNPELMLTHNMLGHLAVYKTSLLRQLGGFDISASSAFEYDLALRALEVTPREKIVHIPRVLYHRLHKIADKLPSTDHLNVVSKHLHRQQLHGTVSAAPNTSGYSRVHFNLPDTLPRVTIIIPTRDRLDILKVCISSLFLRTTYKDFEVIIVDNGSVEPETLTYLNMVREQHGIVVIRDDLPFNFSALNNLAVRQAKGDFVCLMNNDIEILTPEWLEEMLSFAQLPGIGCVGARLLYPNGTVQHGGVLIGFHGVAGHLHKELPAEEAGYSHRAVLHQSLSAVTAACLLVRKTIYEEVGGLDEAFAVAFNDVDFCLKLRAKGYRNIYTPYAELIHHESASRGQNVTPQSATRELAEVKLLKSRWGDQLDDDPAYNPNLTIVLENLSLAWPPRVPSVHQVRTKTIAKGR